MQRYKVFFKDRTLFFTDDISGTAVAKADAIYKYDTANGLKKFIDGFLSKDHILFAVIYSHDIKSCFSTFRSLFKIIIAAGGMVFNKKNEFIGIYRRGMNDLPKGKLDEGETIEECAVREIMEECGIDNAVIKKNITVTYHIYFIDNTPVLKETHWFRMTTTASGLTPQTEEDIENIFWVKPKEIKTFLEKAYPAIKEVVSNEFRNLNF
ncbi:MAG: NUDIX domain-containing protein [Chlorobi bacterium]|nr:NUDIX domain-containing protein [Chlorobiota bacterium]